MNAHVLVKRNADNRHTTSRHVSNERDAGQRTGSVDLVAVDDILVTRDEHTQDTKSEQDR